MNNKIRKIGWLWQWDFLRPLLWKEYQLWLRNVLPPGWSIIAEPEEGADESDYEKLVGITKRLPTTGAVDGGDSLAESELSNDEMDEIFDIV